MKEGSLFSTTSAAFIICRVLDDGHFDLCEVTPLYSFDLHFSNNEQCWALFSCVCLTSVCLLRRNACLGLLPTFSLGCLFYWYWVALAACVFWKSFKSIDYLEDCTSLSWSGIHSYPWNDYVEIHLKIKRNFYIVLLIKNHILVNYMQSIILTL